MTYQSEDGKLLALLSDDTTIRALLARSDLTQKHFEAIKTIYSHFAKTTERYRTNPNSPIPVKEFSTDELANDNVPRQMVRKPATPKNQFSRFLKLKEMTIPSHISRHIADHGSDPQAFFSRSELQHPIHKYDAQQAGDAFLASYYHTIQLHENMAADAAIWGFLMLQYFDICQLLRPGATGSRMGVTQLGDIQLFLAPLAAADIAGGTKHPKFNLSVAADDIYEWCTYGAKINIFVSEFGPGCIFPLAKHLSQDFLKNKVTKSGSRHDEAINHLRNKLGLATLLRDSGTGELGEHIRAFLIRPFKLLHELQKEDSYAETEILDKEES
ncbi:hypothetical protein J4E86_008795 [Alternaria arbusti]|uniref:uncharacterized protein n=1 Tax=Alternaria arbusti TaxID=232088 RepID=UPI002220880F|nr:uncharacterized protein J4E86_008795 [Alternaria arbusti]KAI4947170.1 hypothetical protein J4E86_008795 [Alternaria arbusti]